MTEPRFLYNAQATGITARFTRPFHETIEVHPVSALSTAGGYHSARNEGFRFKEILSYATAHAETAGSYNSEARAHSTHSRAWVTGFNLSNVVVADRIDGHISSSHPASGDELPSISPKGSAFIGLRIAGQEIELESLVDLYSDLDTMQKVRDDYKKQGRLRKVLDEVAFVGREKAIEDERLHKFFPWRRHQTDDLPEYHGLTVVPLFRVKNPSGPGFDVIGNVIHVRNFGRIRLGELAISSYERRVIMLHVELGSPIEGEVNAIEPGGNGGNPEPPLGG